TEQFLEPLLLGRQISTAHRLDLNLDAQCHRMNRSRLRVGYADFESELRNCSVRRSQHIFNFETQVRHSRLLTSGRVLRRSDLFPARLRSHQIARASESE